MRDQTVTCLIHITLSSNKLKVRKSILTISTIVIAQPKKVGEVRRVNEVLDGENIKLRAIAQRQYVKHQK